MFHKNTFPRGLAVLGGVFVLDQVSKIWVLSYFMPWVLLDTAWLKLNIFPSANPGLAFGLSMPTWLAYAIIFPVLTICVYLWQKKDQKVFVRLGLVLIMAGALGNLVDRLRLGAVTDFINVGLFNLTWSQFNVADVAIIGGVGLLLFAERMSKLQKNKLQNDKEVIA